MEGEDLTQSDVDLSKPLRAANKGCINNVMVFPP